MINSIKKYHELRIDRTKKAAMTPARVVMNFINLQNGLIARDILRGNSAREKIQRSKKPHRILLRLLVGKPTGDFTNLF